MSQIKSVLVDNRNVKEVLPAILAELGQAMLWGLDCETTDIETRHEGLNAYCNATRLVFDHRRTTMTGFSTYVEGSDTAYYFNLAHADVANRLHPDIVKVVIEAVNPRAIGVAHNLPFELVMFSQCHGIDLQNFACTLQMAVSHHGPDQYDIGAFYRSHLPPAFHKIAQEVIKTEWSGGDGADRELLGKFIAKESKAEHSYNGFVKSIAMGYSLKALTKSAFGVEQTTFKDVLNGKTHMGELTGDETVKYGADDAYWAVKHYRRMFDDMIKNNPKALKAFFGQENPMVYLYADSWREGIRLDLAQVFRRRDVERENMAALLREFKARVRAALPFPELPHPDLLRKESWYIGKDGDAYKRKRAQIEAWAKSPDSDDDFTQVFQVSNPIGNAWAAEKGSKIPASGKLNIVYYHAMRTIMYDLLRAPMQYDEGSVASDKEARGRIREKLDGEVPDSTQEATELENTKQIMRDLQTMADIEQRVKLYLTPYSQLMDPETSRVYPSLSSQLATRRLAMSFPNAMQLARSGDSAYIRSFYLGDADDHVVISADWSAIELVLIGDFAGGQGGFKPIYGQLPYGDMHSGSAVDCLSIKAMPGLDEAEFKEFKFGNNPNGRPLKDFSGRDLTPQDFHKWARGTAIGKGINFGYWYSGACSTVANNAGLTDTEHWELVDKYRERFPDEERWRISVQEEASMNGFITLPDGHQRNRFECTSAWRQAMMTKFSSLSASPFLTAYAETALKRVQARGRNQVVNAMIQGTCATLAKRSLLNLRKLCDAAGLVWGVDYRLMMPIHDELVFSVHKSAALAFIPLLREAMGTHPDIVKHFPLNCTVAMGRTFRPFDETNPAMSQIELDEAQIIEGIVDKELKGSKLDDDKVAELLSFMFKEVA